MLEKVVAVGGPVSADDVHAFAGRHGLRLPLSYRAFLVWANGGIPVQGHFKVEGSLRHRYSRVLVFHGIGAGSMPYPDDADDDESDAELTAAVRQRYDIDLDDDLPVAPRGVEEAEPDPDEDDDPSVAPADDEAESDDGEEDDTISVDLDETLAAAKGLIPPDLLPIGHLDNEDLIGLDLRDPAAPVVAWKPGWADDGDAWRDEDLHRIAADFDAFLGMLYESSPEERSQERAKEIEDLFEVIDSYREATRAVEALPGYPIDWGAVLGAAKAATGRAGVGRGDGPALLSRILMGFHQDWQDDHETPLECMLHAVKTWSVEDLCAARRELAAMLSMTAGLSAAAFHHFLGAIGCDLIAVDHASPHEELEAMLAALDELIDPSDEWE